jgi:hypothetical protein
VPEPAPVKPPEPVRNEPQVLTLPREIKVCYNFSPLDCFDSSYSTSLK